MTGKEAHLQNPGSISCPLDRMRILQKVCIPHSSIVSYVTFCHIEQQSDKVVLLTRKGNISDMHVFTPDQALEEATKFENDINALYGRFLPLKVLEVTFSSKEELVSLTKEIILNSPLNHYARDHMLGKVSSLNDAF